jgi:hypothetical protein
VQPRRAKNDQKTARRRPGVGCHDWLSDLPTQVMCIKQAYDGAPEQPIQNWCYEQGAETGQEAEGKGHHEQAGTLNPRGDWSKVPFFPLPRTTHRKKAKPEVNGPGAYREDAAHNPPSDRKLVSHTLNAKLAGREQPPMTSLLEPNWTGCSRSSAAEI